MELSIILLKDDLEQLEQQLLKMKKEAEIRAKVLNEKHSVFLLGSESNIQSDIDDLKKGIEALKFTKWLKARNDDFSACDSYAADYIVDKTDYCKEAEKHARYWYLKGFEDAETTETQPVCLEQTMKDAETQFDYVWEFNKSNENRP